MIEELRIDDLGVIERAHVRLGPGLTVLTGETGAGKTMVLTALALLLGAKADPGTVRTGAKVAAVEGRVRLGRREHALELVREAGGALDDDGTLLLLRTVTAETADGPGRSRAHLGGRSVPQAVLAELAGDLVTVHGQADQLRLRTPSRQREALDAFAGTEHLAVLARHRDAWTARAQTAAELAELVARAADRAREAELLRVGLAEVERVAPQPEEDVALAEESLRLSHAEDLRTAASGAHAALVGDEDDVPTAATLVDTARRLLEHAGVNDPALAELARRAAEAGYLVADVAADLAGYLQDLAADPLRLDAVELRRAELGALTRTHGGDVAHVLAWAQEAGLRLLELDGGEDRAGELRERLVALEAEQASLQAELTAARTAAAGRLASIVTTELAGLAMAGARLEVLVGPADAPGVTGADRVEMLLVPHAGAPARPLGKGASGGELSRVMLALEVALATAGADGAGDDERPSTFVFDEVDAGVGGRSAIEVGRRLAQLGRGGQVLVVTHLAQVAAFADTHLVVSKSAADGLVTAADLTEVTGPDRVRELARMLAGQEDSASAQAHAAELLAMSGAGR
ncbi:MAG TPA: DNA repair protein RecN [Cellulomonas sp.]